MQWNRLLGRLGLASADDAKDDRTDHAEFPTFEVDVTPLEPEQLALPQSRGRCQEYKGPFAQRQVIHQRLDFSGCQHVLERSGALRLDGHTASGCGQRVRSDTHD